MQLVRVPGPFWSELRNHKLEREEKQGNACLFLLSADCICADRKDRTSELFCLFSYLRAKAFLTLLKASPPPRSKAAPPHRDVSRATAHKHWWHLDTAVLCVEDTERESSRKRFPRLPGA